jgi:hypothetical protein
MKSFIDTDNLFPIPLSFAVLRERTKRRKEAGELWPYVSDPILAGPRSFCNARREDDRTTRWLAQELRDEATARVSVVDRPAAMVLFRMFNLPQTGETFFFCHGGGPSPFEEALATNSVGPCARAIALQSKPHVGGAYTIPSLNGHGLTKAEGVLAYFAPWFRDNGPMGWRNMFDYWARAGAGPTLAKAHAWYRQMRGVDSFIAAQFVADAKYTEPLSRAPDWFDWAAPGPGSERGLNIINGRAPEASWDERDWLRQLRRLQGALNSRLEAIGDAPLHGQDTQNICCETAKAFKFARSGAPMVDKGNFKSGHRPPLDRVPPSEVAFRARLGEVYEADRAVLLAAGLQECDIAAYTELEPDMLAIWRSYRFGDAKPTARRGPKVATATPPPFVASPIVQ